MFSNIATYYDGKDATIEIIVMLFGMFVLGFLLGFLLFKKNYKEVTIGGKKEKIKKDDLKIIEGIGPKIEKLLNKNKVYTYEDLFNMDIDKLVKVLKNTFKKYKKYNPKTWPDQAKLAFNSSWGELKEYQKILVENKKNK